MKITGIIAEYNIFHNGHKYQIDEIKRGSDAVIAVMSGSFVQRGDVAAADKWTRAEAALRCGADIVFELPVIYALNTAQKFAWGGAALLGALGVVDELCFGSESGDIEKLRRAAVILNNEPKEVSAKIKRLLESGSSYPAARQAAFDGIIEPELLSEPNNILAVEYIRALDSLESGIKPVTIKRYKAGHHDTEVSGNIASASAVREILTNGGDISGLVPKAALDVYKNADMPYSLSALDGAVISAVRLMNAERLERINDISEGLHNRIKAAAARCSSIEELADAIKTKRYAYTRIKRILISSLLGLTKDLCTMPPSYARVLGMNETGKSILKEINGRCSLPIIVKTADYRENDRIFEAETRATDIAALCSPNKEKRTGGRDFTVSPIIV